MILQEKKSQIRRDFTGVYKCQKCGNIQEGGGYDDDYYHNNVIPKMKCNKCGESTNSLGLENQRMATKYAEHEVV